MVEFRRVIEYQLQHVACFFLIKSKVRSRAHVNNSIFNVYASNVFASKYSSPFLFIYLLIFISL